jgi:hypothetical protein
MGLHPQKRMALRLQKRRLLTTLEQLRGARVRQRKEAHRPQRIAARNSLP